MENNQANKRDELKEISGLKALFLIILAASIAIPIAANFGFIYETREFKCYSAPGQKAPTGFEFQYARPVGTFSYAPVTDDDQCSILVESVLGDVSEIVVKKSENLSLSYAGSEFNGVNQNGVEYNYIGGYGPYSDTLQFYGPDFGVTMTESGFDIANQPDRAFTVEKVWSKIIETFRFA